MKKRADYERNEDMLPPPKLTASPQSLSHVEQDAPDALWPVVYDELHGLAVQYFRDEPSDHTLRPTALVHEAYLRLAGDQGQSWESRAQFFSSAARAMRRVLIDHARRRRSVKRGGQRRRVPLDNAQLAAIDRDDDILVLDEALDKLGSFDPQLARVVELRFFAGLTFEDTARTIGVSLITAKRMWKMAKGWLQREIHNGG